MFKPVKMSKVNILLLNKYVTEVTRVLGEHGVLHLVDAVKQSDAGILKGVELQRNQNALQGVLSRCDRLMEGLGVAIEERHVENLDTLSMDEISSILNKIATRYLEQEEAITRLLQNAGIVTRERDDFAMFPLQDVKLEVLRNLSHFSIMIGRLSLGMIPRVTSELAETAIVLPVGNAAGDVLILCANKSRNGVKETLARFGFVEAVTPENAVGNAQEATQEKGNELSELTCQLSEHRMNVMRLSEEYSDVLLAIHSQLKCLDAVQSVQIHFGRISKLYCISGWVPEENLEELKQFVDRVTHGTGILEVIEAEEDALVKSGMESVPVKFHTNSFLRPFQMLITNFGLPAYNEIDPTVFVAVTFIILFGFMFGDLGQGLVLAGVGAWMRYARNRLSQEMKDTGMLLFSCGISAMVFGVLYGSVFGYEGLFHALWVNPVNPKDIGELLLVAVGVGIVFSSLAILINIINHFMARKYFEGVFDRFGVLGLLFYWFALGTGVYVACKGYCPSCALVMIAIPLALLFLKGALKQFVFRRQGEERESLLNMGLEACIELMETFTGYISGTVSFVRVGAFAISHAALCMAVFSIVEMLQKVQGKGVWSLLVIVLGNIGVMGFEGMVVMIQSLRLEYYELFGKYFTGSGVAYKPFVLNNHKKE